MGEAIIYIKKTDAGYPEILHHYERMPNGFYLKGALPDPEKKSVAIVGARACTNYGKTQALHFARCLAREDVQVISGLAYGIDTYAHQGAIEGGGKTFAVLGCGVDVCYPKESYILYEEILKTSGGILSEFEPGARPAPWHFPIRNRIISALADLVLVVEAKVKSGSLITADYALEQGKSVFAVPGRVGDTCSAGCNALIAQGAGIAWSPDAVLEELYGTSAYHDGIPDRPDSGREAGSSPGEADRRRRHLPEEHRKVFDCLDFSEKSVEEIARSCGLESRNVVSTLTFLCMEGYAGSPTPGYYCRKGE